MEIVGRIRHRGNSLMTKELISDEIAVVDHREVCDALIHSRQWVRDSAHLAHTHRAGRPVRRHICTHGENDGCRLWKFQRNKSVTFPVRLTRTVVGEAPKTVSFLGGYPRCVQARESWQSVHGEAWVGGSQSEWVPLQHQSPERGERAQGAQQGLLVLKLTIAQVQTHQLWPYVRDNRCFNTTATCS